MRNPDHFPPGFHSAHETPDFVAVSWNLHKGRSPLGLQAWQSMQRWMHSVPADVYFLQEAMARRMPAPVLASNGFGAPLEGGLDDAWQCQATEIAQALHLQLAL